VDVQYLIKNGTVVDGTGAPAYEADVRISKGRIARIAPDLEVEGRERVVDATGCYVTPGFIESHNHWDAGIFWTPLLEPNAAYGVTTTVNGNCAFSVAPMSADPKVRREMMDIFSYFEDIPVEAQTAMIPWDKWRTWSEYRNALEETVKFPVNFAAYTGHIPLRLTVMGLEAWDRAATPAELDQMCELLDDALAAGSLGLSSNVMDLDRAGRKVPSAMADETEWKALLAVLARYPDSMLQIIVDTIRTMDGDQQAERFGRMAAAAGARMIWLGMPTLQFQKDIRPRFEAVHERFKAEGLEIWTQYGHVAPTIVFTIDNSITFGQQNNQVWQDLVNMDDEAEKFRLLEDPAWREAARASWDGMYAHSTMHDATSLTFIESESGAGPVGVTLEDYMQSAGIEHPSDALAEWILTNGLVSSIHKRTWAFDDDAVLALLTDPRAAGNASDGGAHGQILCGTGDSVYLLTEWVRDRGAITIEQAVHVQTGQLAECFRLHDRGVLEEGRIADVAVFALDEIERRPQEKAWDVPDGKGGRTYRYSRQPAPMRLTLCNGVATFDNGVVTGRLPGRFIGAGVPRALAGV
jgi:N-acyl-D-aspartate/D-glutamate deacylase